MSIRIGLRYDGVRRFVAAALMCLVACGQPPPDGGSSAPLLSSTPKQASAGIKAAARPELAVLGPGERRVALIVVPGDAMVEVDGQPVYRRDGVIDLTGKVGDVRRVRVWKGAKTMVQKVVTIQETQPSPPLVDLNEAPPPKPAAKPVKRPRRYGGFND